MYVDKPAPGLIFSLIIFAIIGAGIILLVIIYHKTGFRIERLFSLSPFYIIPCIILNIIGVVLLSAFTVKYTVTNEKVIISFGFFKRHINLADIAEVREYNADTDRVNEHYCPRFTGFITIQTKKKIVINKIVLTPANPRQFIEEIQKRISGYRENRRL